jgi:predicted N-acyltransferase
MTELVLRSISRLSQIDREAWDALANPPGEARDPFLSWDFLQALEESGCAVEETGWGPRHLLLAKEGGGYAGAVPLYIKTHSQGEYVFDWAWADAYERAGGNYYPKLLTGIPFTPATGRRLLAADAGARRALAAGVVQAAQQWEIGSWHVNFPQESEWQALSELGLLQRMDRQFIWENKDYGSFDDFLADLSSRKRKALRKERREAQDGVEIEALTGAALRPEHWDVFFACYQETGSRKWGAPYLNRDFFNLIHQRMADQVLLVMAKQEGRYIAAALNFIGSEALFGRYWGCLVDKPMLHFELCYHQAVDFAIAQGLARVEAGAQGEHKLARGYRPRPVFSAHWIGDQGFHDALAEYLKREREAVSQDIALLDQESPFKAEG